MKQKKNRAAFNFQLVAVFFLLFVVADDLQLKNEAKTLLLFRTVEYQTSEHSIVWNTAKTLRLYGSRKRETAAVSPLCYAAADTTIFNLAGKCNNKGADNECLHKDQVRCLATANKTLGYLNYKTSNYH